MLRLYDKDVKAANDMLQSGEMALQALRAELKRVRCTEKQSEHPVRQHEGALNKDVEKSVENARSSNGRRLESSEDSSVAAEPEAECLDEDVRPTKNSCNDVERPETAERLDQNMKLTNNICHDVERLITPPSSPGQTCATDRKAIESQVPTSPTTAPDTTEAAERLQHAIVDAAAALAALLGTSSMPSLLANIAQDAGSGLQKEDGQDDSTEVSEFSRCEVRQRARSEGAELKYPAPALVKDRRRRSRGGDKLRVSFAGVDPSPLQVQDILDGDTKPLISSTTAKDSLESSTKPLISSAAAKDSLERSAAPLIGSTATKDSLESGIKPMINSTVAQTQRRLSLDEPDREPGLSEPGAAEAAPEALSPTKANSSRQEPLTVASRPPSGASANLRLDVARVAAPAEGKKDAGRVGSTDRRKKKTLHDFRRSISREKLSRPDPPAASVSSAPVGMLDFL